MSAINLTKIDKFVVALVIVLVIMSGLVIYTFRTVFSTALTAFEIDQSGMSDEMAVKTELLDKTYKFVTEK